MNKNIARLAVTAGLTAALSFGGVMAPVTMAFAAGTPMVAENGNVTIKEDTYKNTTFKGIQVFKAKVTQDKQDDVWNGSKTLSDITWASPEVETAVKSVFADATDKPAGTATAQDWADYITEKAGDNVGEKVKVDADSVLDKIAKALEGVTETNETTGWKTSTDGKFNNLPAGYWLFVTAQPGSTKVTDKTNGKEDAYTSPIFAIVGGADVNAEPKKDVPNVTKAVKDDKDGKWVTDDNKTVFQAANKAADSAAGQPVEYQLAGTVASNINTYVKYSYTFTDELPLTMVPELGNDNKPVVKVIINDTIVSSDSYKVSYNTADGKNTLSVSFDNLKEAKDSSNNPITVNGDSKVYVNYSAQLNPNKITADMLGIAQENKVELTYSNNPHTNGTGTTVDHPAYDYTYGIDVTKVGSDEGKDGQAPTLAGVEFTLQEVVDGGAENKYIDAKGVKRDDAKDATLKTDKNGKINVIGLDEGTYILKETKPAPGYNNSAANGVTFTIKRSLNQTGQDVEPSTDSAITAGGNVVQNDSATATTGKLSFTIVDQKGSGLPLTGLNGVTFTWIAGGAVLCIGVAHLIRSRKQAEESEQE
ncbi:SpaA isopeptide-forming pilin-related protein [Collinsella aerofaciens]|uniref:SpaA isopeptide-forming pilin-related protein n=1 Tax=Collinsella aerofaciens TaxID=74426 RepID=UPI00290AB6D2|nr:SpaA isopeptide-forming pilin-related protein [Collinsella aerofaciens]MDU8576338.1 SpaA isopeptide-forming pilin-related protein [Collinsella aerofaciens]